MQTNVMCSLPRKEKFPDQKLGVLLEVPDFAKRPSPRLKLHAFPSPPTGVYGCLAAGAVWLAQLFPCRPLLACPTFCIPWCLLRLSRLLLTSLLFFFATKFFGVVFVRAILKKYGEHKLLCWLLG